MIHYIHVCVHTYIYLGTGYFAGVRGAKLFNSASGNILFSTNMTVSQHFLPFQELFSDPGAVPDCFGLPCFRNFVAWNLVDTRVRKFFNGTWYIGTVSSYKLHRQWFAVKSSDGLEEYSLDYYSELHPSAFFLAFDLAMLVMLALHAKFFCFPFLFSPGADSFDSALCSLIEQATYSITAQAQQRPMLACPIHAKPAVSRSGVLSPFCPLAEESVFIPIIDQQAEKQQCASDRNADKELCLARHRDNLLCCSAMVSLRKGIKSQCIPTYHELSLSLRSTVEAA
jgi:hypothetical protein